MTVDWSDWQPHPHMALAQYAQGVPLARKPLSIANGSNTVNVGGTNTIVSNLAIDQPAFQAVLFLQYGAGVPTIPFVELDLTWTDTASGFSLKPDSLFMPVGQAGPTSFIITGPCRMDELTVTIKNLDTVLAVSYSVALSQTSHVYDKLRLEEVDTVTIPTFNPPAVLPAVGTLLCTTAVVPATGHIDHLAKAWSGLAQISIDNSQNSNPMTTTLIDPGQSVANVFLYGTAGTGLLASFIVPAMSTVVEQVVLPYGPVVVRRTNLAAAPFAEGVTLIRLDQ